MATHSSILAWRIPGTGKPDGLPSMGSHRVGHDWSDLAAAAASKNTRDLSQSSISSNSKNQRNFKLLFFWGRLNLSAYSPKTEDYQRKGVTETVELYGSLLFKKSFLFSPFYLFIYLFWVLHGSVFFLILFNLTLQYCIGFAIYQHESATGIHVSPSWTLLPPPSPYHPSGSSHCTSPKHPVSCIEPGLATRFIHDVLHVSMPFSQIFPPSPSPTESIRLFYTSVSLLLSRTQGYCYHLSKFHIYVLVYCTCVFLSGLLHSV